MKKFLGIDQSYTSSGYVVINEDGSVVDLGTIKTLKDVDGDIYDRAIYVSEKCIDLARMFNPEKIGMEGLAFSKFGNATRDLAGLQFVLITDIRATPYGRSGITIVSPNLLKKFATGKGGAKKQDMADALPAAVLDQIKSLGYKKTKGLYDIADAYWIAQYTLEEYKKSLK